MSAPCAAAPLAAHPRAGRLWRRARARLRDFGQDAEGAVLVSIIIYSAALLAMLGLVVDVGRTYAEQARMQSYLDSVAIAAAAELDGQPDALDRAAWIISNGVIAKSTVFSSDADAFAIKDVFFLSGPPRGPRRGKTANSLRGLITDDPTKATHVLVTAVESSVRWSFLRLLSSAEDYNAGFKIGAWAAARPMRGPECMTPLLAVIAPDGASKADLGAPGRQLRLSKGLDGQWQSGEYALISDLQDDAAGACSGYFGANRAACLLAIDSHESACKPSVDIMAGEDVDVAAGLNTRFDIWAESVAGLQANPGASSDMNVISGDIYSCVAPDYGKVSSSMGLPVDDCFDSDACGALSGPMAPGRIDLYWRKTHGGPPPPGLATRADVYRLETAMGRLDPLGAEDSTRNLCNPTTSAKEDRRVFQVAIVDRAGLQGREKRDVPVKYYADVLLTNPVRREDDFVIGFDDRRDGRWMAAGDVLSDASPYADVGVARIAVKPSTRAGGGHAAANYDDASGDAGDDGAVGEDNAGSRNLPMLFDAANPTGGADDPLAHTTFGNVLIVSASADPAAPVPEARGGWLIFGFSEPTEVKSLRVLGSELGGVIRLYASDIDDPVGEWLTVEDGLARQHGGDGLDHDPRETRHVAIPLLERSQSVTLAIDEPDVLSMAIFLPGRGAVDDVTIANSRAAPARDDEILLEMIGIIEPGPVALTSYPVLSD